MSAIVTVHQVGKVGSTSVVETLRKLLPGQAIHQTHVLSERRMLDALRRWLERSRQFPGFKIEENMRSSIEISRALVHGLPLSEWHVLSLVREPVGRNVSALFQNLRRVWAHKLPESARASCLRLLDEDAIAAPDEIEEVAAALVAHFQSHYPREFVDRWFDEEMLGVFGIDVFAEPFPKEQGWRLYRKGTVRLLVARLEDLESVFDPAVRSWLGDTELGSALADRPRLELERANDASQKNYALLYQAFLELLTLDASLVDAEYATRTARHFYSSEELACFSSKWKTSPALDPAIA